MSRDARWTRRSLLGLGLGSVGLLIGSTPARATSVTVGELAFEMPEGFRAAASGVQLGRDWQWSAVRDGRSVDQPEAVVLARADLDSTAPDEILGLLLAPSLRGMMPDLRLGGTRTRAMPGGSETRLEVSYAVSRGFLYHGAISTVTRKVPPAGVLVVLGDDTLTAGTIDRVLDSARWLS